MFYSRLIIALLNLLDFFQQKKIIKLIKIKFLRPITVFDVGGHHGETIKLFSSKLKIKKIYSFEASPQNFQVLKKKISKKHVDSGKVEIFNFGLGNKISKSFINQAIESSSSTINELNKESNYLKRKLKILNIKKKDNFYQKIPIQLVTLDSFIEKHNIQKVDLLKIDTEGYELNVLNGFEEKLVNVNVILFEHHYDLMIKKNYTFSDINNFLNKNGFIQKGKFKMPLRKTFEYIYINERYK